MVEELLWNFNFTADVDQEKRNSFFDDFVTNFVEANEWLCGGSDSMGMFDPNNKTSIEVMQKALLKYLTNYKEIIDSITIHQYDKKQDEFINGYEITIS